MDIKVYKKHKDATLPTRKHPEDAGLDLYCLEDISLLSNSISVHRTGISLVIPPGFFGLIKPKGGSNHLVGAGVVDENYRGEILVKLVNPNEYSNLNFVKGSAIAQIIIVPVIYPTPLEIDYDPEKKLSTTRGSSGGIWDSTFEDVDVYYINGD